MIKARVYLAGISLAVAAAAAQADVTFTPTVVSDYDFRGFTQTATDPALQLSVDFTSGPIHVGAWGSNVDFGTSSTELDLLADYTFGSDETVKATTGLVYYTYPGAYSSASYPEIWVNLAKGWFGVAAHYSWDWAGFGTDASYFEGNVTVPLAETGFGITGHVGYSSGQYWADYDYTDYAIGVTKSFGKANVALKYVSSDFDYDPTTSGRQKKIAPGIDTFSTEGRVILSVSTTLPWAE
jgi:uncharacterized protein (TIGR02001 family)